MSQSIKFDNDNYLDATGIRDSNRAESQANINNLVPVEYTSTVRAWPGATLVFNNVTASNGLMYELLARRTDINSMLVHLYFTIRDNGLIYSDDVGKESATLTYSSGTLTVTLPNAYYWIYSLRLLHSNV